MDHVSVRACGAIKGSIYLSCAHDDLIAGLVSDLTICLSEDL